MATLTNLPNSRWGEWIRFASSALVIPVLVFAIGFAVRVERYMARCEVQMVSRQEFEERLSKVRDGDSPAIQLQLAAIKEAQANLAFDIANMRKDIVTLMLSGRAR
jgi:hypothetical protein